MDSFWKNPMPAPSGKVLRFLVHALALLPLWGVAHPETKPEGDARAGGIEKSETDSVELEISVLDGETKRPIPAMIRVLDEEDQPRPITGLLDRCIGLPKKARGLGWYVLRETSTVLLPADAIKVEAVSGLEYSREIVSLDLGEGASLPCRIELSRFWNAREQGWISGNTHLHLKDLTKAEADRYLTEVSEADGLQLVFVSYLERALVDRSYTTNEYSREELESLTSKVTKFGNGQEYRHNFGGGGEGYGHVLFLNQSERVSPSSLGPGISQSGDDGTSLREGIEFAHGHGNTIVWCHNQFGFEDIPSWLSGLVHAQNIFDGGNKGRYEDTFYRYLNLGFRVPFSTGTDWFLYDFSRVYARATTTGFSVEDWLSSFRGGETFITNGPILEFSVNGEGPGGSVPSADTVEVAYRVLSRENCGIPEMVMNGYVTPLDATVLTEHAGWWEGKGSVTIGKSEPYWVALRIAPGTDAVNEFQNQLFAHTSPVFVNTDRGEVFDPATAKGMIEEIESDLSEIERQGVFGSDAEKDSVRELYREAIRELQNRLRK